MSTPLQNLFQSALLWRGDQLASPVATVPTSFAALDSQLPGGGWQLDSLIEVMLERPGIGEMQLFFPALKQALAEGKSIVIVSPPYMPYPPALLQHGLDPAQTTLIHTADQKERLWAFEQALRSRACGAALIWLAHVEEKHMRRLQLAANEGKGLAIVFRPAASQIGSSWAALRLHLFPEEGQLGVRILKRRGGGLPAPMRLALFYECGLNRAKVEPSSSGVQDVR
ncbi:MAG TPA: translesion DNA synthesis-associated protein ImuA [Burkholderiales bacterium]|nr:translesion DNA synthesis-associated protein ImuA [Burkholderiales bacterium]